jgi:hypothetical protein
MRKQLRIRPSKAITAQTKDNDTIVGLIKKYPWWALKAVIEEQGDAPPFEGKSTFILTQKTALSGELIRL